ncbi:MAG: DUF5682 family protein [Micrococcales bacterium]|nr:DUF5682 family protein [Micrococcales bacterium]
MTTLTVAGMRSLAGRLVTDDLVVVGVRHHSPACARVVMRVFAERTPSVVLVEGPRSFDPLVPLLTHPQARMPLAVYAYVDPLKVDDEERNGPRRQAAYYPFADYSPELVALRLAAEHGVPARFCDLDLVEHDLAGPNLPGHDGRGSLLDEGHYAHSQGLAALAARLGCRDAEDLWELLFETAGPLEAREHAARVCAYAAPAREDSRDTIDTDGTTAREAEMAHHVRAALAARAPGDGPVLVVVGAFHALALPDLLTDPPPRPSLEARDVRTGEALIRYTFDRMDRLHGYGAGMTSPGWYQRLWDRDRQAPEARGPNGGAAEPSRVSVVVDTLMDIVVALRQAEHEAPVPQTTAALEHALRLAALRGHSTPLRSDLLDAVTATMVRGDMDVDGTRTLDVVRKVLTGTAMGVVPPGAGRPPLVDDALDRARAAGLDVDTAKRSRISLDLYRKAKHRQTSRLLHGLVLLGAPLGVRTGGPDFVAGTKLGRLQERWEYSWNPAVEGALVEAALYGSTVPEAVAAKFDEALTQAGPGADQATAGLARALVLGLHEHAVAVVPRVRGALVGEPVFTDAVTAAVRLALLVESREPLEAMRVEGLDDLLAAAYRRVVYLGHESLTGEPPDVVGALVRVRELLVSQAGSALDAELFWPVVVAAAQGHDSPQVRGGASGLLFSAGRWDDAALGAALRGMLAGGAAHAVDFVVGLLTTAREAVWQIPAVLEVLDGFLVGWSEEDFLGFLPSLRLAFAELTPRETDQVAGQVAVRHGVSSLGPLVRRDVSARQVQANLELSLAVRCLLVRDGLGGWVA